MVNLRPLRRSEKSLKSNSRKTLDEGAGEKEFRAALRPRPRTATGPPRLIGGNWRAKFARRMAGMSTRTRISSLATLAGDGNIPSVMTASTRRKERRNAIGIKLTLNVKTARDEPPSAKRRMYHCSRRKGPRNWVSRLLTLHHRTLLSSAMLRHMSTPMDWHRPTSITRMLSMLDKHH